MLLCVCVCVCVRVGGRRYQILLKLILLSIDAEMKMGIISQSHQLSFFSLFFLMVCDCHSLIGIRSTIMCELMLHVSSKSDEFAEAGGLSGMR